MKGGAKTIKDSDSLNHRMLKNEVNFDQSKSDKFKNKLHLLGKPVQLVLGKNRIETTESTI